MSSWCDSKAFFIWFYDSMKNSVEGNFSIRNIGIGSSVLQDIFHNIIWISMWKISKAYFFRIWQNVVFYRHFFLKNCNSLKFLYLLWITKDGIWKKNMIVLTTLWSPVSYSHQQNYFSSNQVSLLSNSSLRL